MAGIIQKNVNNTNLQTTQKQSVNQLMDSLLNKEAFKSRFNEILGERTPQFISSLITLINADANLTQAFYESPMTVIQAGLKAAVFDLPIDPNLGYAYIVPFKNSKKTDSGWTKVAEASFILGWKGMHQLALRTGAYKTINVVDIREGELKKYNRLTEEVEINFIEDDELRETKAVVGYLGYYKLVNGAEKTIYMTIQQIQNHEKKFRKGDIQGKGWRDDWDAMARKTVYRRLIGKWGVMSIEYQNAGSGLALAQQMAEEGYAEEPVVIPDFEVVESELTDMPEILADKPSEGVTE